MTSLRVMIVDDERVARERLRAMLAVHDVEVVAECREGIEAVHALAANEVDAVFLDVRMPGLDGFGVVREVGPERMPDVVFVTAYDAYAVRAFEVQAVDYLLKPYDQARLDLAVERVRRRRDGLAGTDGARDELASRLRALLDGVTAPDGATRLLVRTDGRTHVVRADDVDWVEAADNHVRLHLGRSRLVMRGTLSALEEKLDPRRFARVHRSAIVNLDRVREVQPMFRGDCVAILRDGTKVAVSAPYRDALLRALGTRL